MDVISLAQSDIKFAVASLGNFVENSNTKNVELSDTFICFDGDDAGRNSSKNIA